MFPSWHIIIDHTVAAACAVLSVSATESPQALGNSFDATHRLKCLDLRERDPSGMSRADSTGTLKQQINGGGLQKGLSLFPTLLEPFHPGETWEGFSQLMSRSYALQKGSHKYKQ